MNFLRTTSTRRLIAGSALVVALASAACRRQAAGGGGTAAARQAARPPRSTTRSPRPADGRHRAHPLHQPPDRRAARCPTGSPLLTGATGRLWLTGDGRLRLELQSDAGDAQIIVSDGKRHGLRRLQRTPSTAPRCPQARRDQRRPAPRPPTLGRDRTALAEARRGRDALGRRRRPRGRPARATRCGRAEGRRRAARRGRGRLGRRQRRAAARRDLRRRAALARCSSSTATDISYGPSRRRRRRRHAAGRRQGRRARLARPRDRRRRRAGQHGRHRA